METSGWVGRKVNKPAGDTLPPRVRSVTEPVQRSVKEKPPEQQGRSKANKKRAGRRRRRRQAHGCVVVEFAAPQADEEMRSASDLKRYLWQTVTAKRKDMRFDSVQAVSGGRIIVRPGDDSTLEVLKAVSSERLKVKELTRTQPRMLLYDVPSDMPARELVEAIVEQNAGRLGNDLRTISSRIIPKFKTGPREGELVHWVIETDPELAQKFEDLGRLYIGMSHSRIVTGLPGGYSVHQLLAVRTSGQTVQTRRSVLPLWREGP